MTSWKLLHSLTMVWQADENPLLRRALSRPPRWYALYQRMARVSGLLLVLGGLACYGASLLAFYLDNVLALLVPLVAVWPALLGLALAPVVVEERQQQTWDALRTTPLSLETILLGKAAGVLWWLRVVLRFVLSFVLVIAAVIGLISLVITLAITGDERLPALAVCGAMLLIPALAVGLFVVDRAQQFTLTAAAALAASASSRSLRSALVTCSVVAVGVWFADLALALVLVSAFPTHSAFYGTPEFLTWLVIGPLAAYVALPLPGMLAATALTFALREIALRILWRWTLHAARAS